MRSQLRLVVVSLVVVGCASLPQPEPARVVQLGPSGEATEADLRQGITLLFDRPVVPPEDVGRELLQSPVNFAPAVAGRARWADRQTLVFTPAQALRRETRYRVALTPPARRGAGAAPRAFAGHFVYERLELRRVSFAAPDPDRQPREPVVRLAFNHPVAAAAVAGACLFDGARGAVAARPVDGETTVAAAVRLRPAQALPAGAEHHLRCPAGLRGLEGAEGLAAAVDAAFRTYGPLAVESLAPTGRDVAADDVAVRVVFSNPVPPAQVRRHVYLVRDGAGAPRTRLRLSGSADRRTYAAKVDLEAGTPYLLVVQGALRDAFDQRLGRDRIERFDVGDATPRIQLKRGIYAVELAAGAYPLWTRNVSRFAVRCARVPASRLTALLTGPFNYDAWFDASAGDPLAPATLGVRPRSRRVAIARPKNKWIDQRLDLAATCGGDRAHPSGVYLLEVTSDEVPLGEHERARRVLANVTDLGLVAKVGNASSLVWVVRLSTGAPVVGATVAVRDLKGRVRFTGRTGADGILLAPGATKLLGTGPRRGGTDEAEEEDFEEHRARRVIVTARLADDLAVLDTNWNNGVQIWNFGVPEDRGGGAVRVRGFLQSDRGIYRPGETVHLRGLARIVAAGGAMRLPRSRRVKVVVEDPRGAPLVDERLPLSAFGGFHRDLRLPAEARLGDYLVTGTVDGQTFRERFAVEEYRPRAFEVKVRPATRHAFVGERPTFDLTASYLYGAPLAGGTVSWAVRRRPHLPAFPGFRQYTFQDLAAFYAEGWYWARSEQRSFSVGVGDGERRLDGRGRLHLAVTDDVRRVKGPVDYLLTATVSDASGQAVSVQEVVTAHRAGLYLGLHPAELVQAVDMPFAVQAVALTPAGKRRAATVELTVTRRRHRCDDGGVRCAPRDDPPAVRRSVAVPATGAAVARVVLREPGQYTVRVTAPDERGGRAVASEVVYVIGAGEAFWSGDEGDRMGLVASKPTYQPGDAARLVPQTRLPGATALVTLERDGVVRAFVRPLRTSGEGITVPIDATLAPNVFASVTLVRGRVGAGLAGRPRFKMGVVNLEVDTASKRLRVEVETTRPSYRPGEVVEGALKVTTAAGAPVVAEVAVAVADEGVLQIAGYRTPDPMKTFYRPFALGVESSTTWNRVAVRGRPGEVDPEEGGDGGGDEAGRIRSRFVATAFWAPALRTDRDGTARFRFPAPDNLTAFRVMAVAADQGDRFGAGERRFTVAKPLVVLPALPRFLTVGDAVAAAVVVHNHTGAAGRVTVTAAVTGARLDGPAARQVAVAAGGSRRVAFPLRVAQAGRAQLRFRARLGAEVDAVAVTLPVTRPLARETRVVAEGRTAGRVAVPLRIPAGTVRDEGGLELVLDTAGLASLDEGLRYLVGYPYGCLEQTTSQVVPMVALGELVGSAAVPGVSRGRLRSYVTAGIAKILRHQHGDGAFGLWPGAPAEAHLTAYALWGLHLARQAGYRVDPRALATGVASLRRAVNRRESGGAADLGGRTGTQAFALYVLASLGAPETGAAARLHEGRAALPLYGKAFLLRALHRAGQGAAARELLAEIVTAAPAGSGPVLLAEPGAERLWWYLSSSPRTTAIVLSALLEVAPTHPLAPRLAAGLLAARQAGRWANTQENLYALVALADYARARSRSGPVQVTVSLDGHRLLRARLRGAEVRRVSVPLRRLAAAGNLVVEAAGHEVAYAARLRLARPVGGAPLDAGLAVAREYLDPRTGVPVTRLALGQVVKVRVTVRAAARQTHVAVVDRLPAGLEPVLDRFAPPPARPRSWWRPATPTVWSHRQLRDDRVELFADVLAAGTSSQEYLARATSAGVFVAPPAAAEAMYQPERHGRSAAGTLTVAR